MSRKIGLYAILLVGIVAATLRSPKENVFVEIQVHDGGNAAKAVLLRSKK